MKSVKERTINGLVWSAIEQFSTQGITFIIGIVLARLLSPTEFGLMGMITIFLGVASVFVQSGFNQALIRKKNCSEEDYSTVFYFNLVVSILLYVLLFVTAPYIAQFYEEPVLTNMVRVLGLMLIINAFTIVQLTKITKSVAFKELTKITLLSGFLSGGLAIALASQGYGVWSLVGRQLLEALITTALLWLAGNWRPVVKPSKKVLKSLWGFSSKLVFLALIDTAYNNIYNVIIGKLYPTANLGQYRQAENFRNLPSRSLGSAIDRVSFPILASVQHEANYSGTFDRLMRSTMLVSFISMIGLAAIAEELITLLLGAQWELTGKYLQILCFVAMFYPLDKLLSSVLKVAGRSDLVLRQGLIRKLFAIPVIITAIFIGVETMLYVMIAQQFFSMLLLAKFSSEYSKLEIYDIYKGLYRAFVICFGIFIALTILGDLLTIDVVYLLIFKVVLGAILLIGILELIQIEEYKYLKNELKLKSKTLFRR